MRKAFASITAVALAVLILGGAQASGRAGATVAVADDIFAPAFLKVEEDRTVKFEWTGTNMHNVFKKEGPGRYFESDNFEGPGIHYSRKFAKPGSYVLGCTLHEEMLMDLKVKRRR